MKNSSFLCRFARIAVLALLMLSCQTIPRPAEQPIPATLLDLFDSCDYGDGSFQIRFESPGQLIDGINMEWKIHPGRSWGGQLFTHLGKTLLIAEYSYGQSRFNFTGELAPQASRLSVGSSGLLEVDGRKIGLTPKEMFCFFKFKLPDSWYKTGYYYGKDAQGAQLKYSDGKRRIGLVIHNSRGHSRSRSACATVAWNGFWLFFEQKIQICFDWAEYRQVTVTGVENFLLRWIDNDL